MKFKKVQIASSLLLSKATLLERPKSKDLNKMWFLSINLGHKTQSNFIIKVIFMKMSWMTTVWLCMTINSDQWRIVGLDWSECTLESMMWLFWFWTQEFIGSRAGTRSLGSLWWRKTRGMSWRIRTLNLRQDGI